MNPTKLHSDPNLEASTELTIAILQATVGLTEAAQSLSALTQKKDRAQKPAFFRRGLNRTEAADYIGISTTKFGQLVQEKRMPKPKQIDGRYVWDVYALDSAFDALDPSKVASASENPWN